MIGLFCFSLAVLASPFKSKLRLEAENAVLRHQLIVLRRRLHGRVWLTNHDRRFLIQLYRWFPSILQVLTIVRPETLVRWHRAGFRCYWRWKSRSLGARPQIDTELRALIRQMSSENPLWGAPRIHGELLKLGFEVAQGPPSQGWQTFLHNHAPDIAAMDLFVVPTIGFDMLYAFLIVRLDRRKLVHARQVPSPLSPSPQRRWLLSQGISLLPPTESQHSLGLGVADEPTCLLPGRRGAPSIQTDVPQILSRDFVSRRQFAWQNGGGKPLEIQAMAPPCVTSAVPWEEGLPIISPI